MGKILTMLIILWIAIAIVLAIVLLAETYINDREDDDYGDWGGA